MNSSTIQSSHPTQKNNSSFWSSLSSFLLILELISLPLIAICSWICSIYIPSVRSLLAPSGLRWISTSIISNFTAMPISPLLLILLSLSIIISSGILSPVTSPKQKRALTFAFITLLLNLLAIFALTFIPPYILLNFFGTLSHSPLTDSIPGFLLILTETICTTYAYTSGRLTTIRDFTAAHTSLLSRFSPLFLHLFLLSQLIGWLGYSFFFDIDSISF